MRGFSNTSFPGCVIIRDVGESPDAWHSTPDLGKACELQLQNMLKDRPSEAAAAWGKYRTTLWQTDARGQFDQLPSARLLELITATRVTKGIDRWEKHTGINERGRQ